MSPGQVEAIAEEIMNKEQREVFKHELEMNLAISIPNLGKSGIVAVPQRKRARECEPFLVICGARNYIIPGMPPIPPIPPPTLARAT